MLQQHVVQLVAIAVAMAAETAAEVDVDVDIAASRCQNCVAQNCVAQSCVAQRSACLSATLVAAADVVHLADHLAGHHVPQAAVHQSQLLVLALATDINRRKGKLNTRYDERC